MAVSRTGHGFFGGAPLAHYKDLVMHRPIALVTNIDVLRLPLTGHGLAQEPDLETRLQVSPGEHVVAGQMLLQSDDDMWPALHAPIDGVIGDLTEGPSIHAHGQTVRYLTLSPNKHISPAPFPNDAQPDQALPELSLDALADAALSHGIVGLGGARFSTAEKLRQGKQQIHTLIINGVECEPYIACDEALMRQRPNAIVFGAKLIAQALGVNTLMIAIEDPLAKHQGSVSGLLQNAIEQQAPSDIEIEVITLPQRFPQGSERQLIQTLTGLEVPHLGLPQDLGVLCHNVATCASLFDAVVLDQPLTHRLVSVTGDGVGEPMNVYAPIGLSVTALLDLAGGLKTNCSRLMLGGPLSGEVIVDHHASIDKGSLCVLALTEQDTASSKPVLPCINCGFCVTACPANLLPQLLYKTAQQGQYAKTQSLGLFDCIECGLCAEVCPSHLPLLDSYRHAKDWLRAKALDERRAELAKRRHQARQTRLEAQAKAKEARRQARAERLQAQASAQSEIEAAIARAKTKKHTAND